ncbi:ATP phosphoribosyltransferase [Candidatus Dojkabacteria bacterium]|uniref:ATP phosphoribosyltransferase n=1 Tax=Candidatus Dojkabacteria bacterium TaxID=2099670 RepID=A0A3M0Z053_9BACT|nr:MAG: ATP phosphoribosyltransferase [Candidatus Dojkabacteria bacterium]
MSDVLKFGIPKGSLEAATIELFKKAGWIITPTSRNYFPTIDDEEIKCNLIRSQEMSIYVEKGTIDAGIAGYDWVLENNSDVVKVCDLVYSKVSRRPAKWVLVVTEDSPIKKLEDLKNKTIATELVNFTKKFFQEKKIPVKVEFSWGATEAKVVEGLCDAIVEVTETGSTIKANGLRIVDTLLVSNPILMANKKAWKNKWKKEKINQIATLLQAALRAENMVGIKLNAPKKSIEDIVKILPSLNYPTISNLYNSEWVSIESVLPEKQVRVIIPKLLALGAQGIIEYSLNKII